MRLASLDENSGRNDWDGWATRVDEKREERAAPATSESKAALDKIEVADITKEVVFTSSRSFALGRGANGERRGSEKILRAWL